jgi:hypothetical protein
MEQKLCTHQSYQQNLNFDGDADCTTKRKPRWQHFPIAKMGLNKIYISRSHKIMNYFLWVKNIVMKETRK